MFGLVLVVSVIGVGLSRAWLGDGDGAAAGAFTVAHPVVMSSETATVRRMSVVTMSGAVAPSARRWSPAR
ncbi:hypothetical protein Apa02nite_045870 [Actinoplanes palleronii]|uniref:Uncharacterized protein n=1 Tax=Actinoplanes palleronii TaxID=113570 RepID=A0ABQ4BCR3_9ACTN|nr:hypothetical protein Apa02nite_045870 [Actinoplanes palleronii]